VGAEGAWVTVAEAKVVRVKIASAGEWHESSVSVDGKGVFCQEATLHLGVDEPTTLRLTALQSEALVDMDFVSAEEYRKLVEEVASLRVALQLERAVVQNIRRIPLKVTVT